MKLIKQEAFNECGISCANMLINYYYQCSNNFRYELLNQTNLTNSGISIYELEKVCSKYDIELNAYQMEKEEFESLDTHKKPVILILNNDEFLHYVIAFIKKLDVIIYDPNGTKYKISKKELFQRWTGYIIFSKKYKQNWNIFKNESKKIIDIKLSLKTLFLFLELIQFVSCFLFSFLISKIINLSTEHLINGNLLKLSLIFFSVVILNICTTYLNNQIKLIYFNRINKQTIYQYFDLLKYKNFNFFKMNSFTQILKNLKIVNQIMEFYLFFWSEIIYKIIIFISIAIGLVLIINSFWIVILIHCLLISLFSFINFKINNQYFQIYENKINYIDKNFIDHFIIYKNSHYFENKNNLFNNIGKNFVEQQNYEVINQSKQNAINIIYKFINYISQFILLIYLWNSNKLSIGGIILTFNFFNWFTDCSSSLASIVQNKILIKPLEKIYHSFINTNNIEINKNKLDWFNNSIESIEYSNHKFNKNILIDTPNLENHILIKSLFECQELLDEIKINSINLNNINQKDIYENFIYINSDYSINKDYIKSLFADNSNFKYFQNLALPNFNIYDQSIDSFPKQIKIFLILLSIANLKNKIICFNNLFDAQIDDSILKNIYLILEKINQNNFIISNFDNPKMMSFYENQI